MWVGGVTCDTKSMNIDSENCPPLLTNICDPSVSNICDPSVASPAWGGLQTITHSIGYSPATGQLGRRCSSILRITAKDNLLKNIPC